MHSFEPFCEELRYLVGLWEPRLNALTEGVISKRRNSQNRTIRQILGHLVDSASNNTHRMVHLQYRPSPMQFPNYATEGNNDRWIAIQDYQHEDWRIIVQLWKYANLHVIHVISHVDPEKLNNQWQAGENRLISLKDMITEYLNHFKLHLSEIDELIRGK